MARTESSDKYEFPPGLGVVPRPGTNIHNYHQSAATPLGEFPPFDRRNSLGMGYDGISPMISSVPRSIGLNDQEYGIFGTNDGWPIPSPPNRANPLSQLQPTYIPHPAPIPHFASPSNRSAPPANTHGLSYPVVREDFRFFGRELAPGNSRKSPYSPPAVPAASTADFNTANTRSTLHWRDLEPWMDEEWAKRVCGMMNWDPVNIKVPHPQADLTTGQQANNPGYCFLTFPTREQAERAFSQVNPNTGGQVTMPNSSRPFNISWAASLPTTPLSTTFSPVVNPIPGAQQQYPREYSIFVGDLAPETSNSDLVAVFRNPVLGLRNDREPKFIRPFLSCKSAKIMLDPVTGVSRGYGFVRFTDEADQQRALIEMHGLYCLSRPMRISPATAKFKQAPVGQPADMSQVQAASPTSAIGQEQRSQPATAVGSLPNSHQNNAASSPLPMSTSNSSIGNTMSSSGSVSSLSSTLASSNTSISSFLAMASPEERSKFPPQVLAELAQYMGAQGNGKNSPETVSAQQENNVNGQDYGIPEESWKHHVQARAILGNLMGPNGEQLTSTDPYNTTVFVGGLSPLIGEDTLRSFFAPFGEIHYVKVPVGKHCGFVQFVRKADAERAISEMQGHPIGGSKIRLSWGRSQYKAAQAAAQAAQTTAIHAQFQPQVEPAPAPQLSPEQAMQLLQRLGLTNLLDNKGSNVANETREYERPANDGFGEMHAAGFEHDEKYRFMSGMMEPRQNRIQKESKFSPFSPDPNQFPQERTPLPPYKYTPGNYHSVQQPNLQTFDSIAVGGFNGNNERLSPASLRHVPMNPRFGSSYLDESSRRQEGPISRPNSGTPSNSHAQRDGEGMSELNGTFAGLELDPQAMWKSQSTRSYQANAYEQATASTRSNHGTPSP